MTNQQLAETCRDILAEAKYQEEWLVAMAKALLPCLEAEPKYQIRSTNRQGWIDIDTEDLAVHHHDNMGYEMREYYTGAPAPELKPIELRDEIDFEDGTPTFCAGANWMRKEAIEAIRAAGYEVKS